MLNIQHGMASALLRKDLVQQAPVPVCDAHTGRHERIWQRIDRRHIPEGVGEESSREEQKSEDGVSNGVFVQEADKFHFLWLLFIPDACYVIIDGGT